MKRGMISVLFCSLCTLLFCLPMLGAADAPGDDFKVNLPDGVTGTKPQVTLPHSVHATAGVECATCHHTMEAEGGVKRCGSAGCHTNMEGQKGDDNFRMAFHNTKAPGSCLGCHKAMKKENKKAGPTSCRECHKD